MTIEKFEGSFSKEELGVTLITGKVIKLLKKDSDVLGVYVYLMSLPPDWQINCKHLMDELEMSKDKLYRILNHLKQIRLITVTEIRERGKFTKNHYTVHHRQAPLPENQDMVNSPYPEKPDTVKPYPENQDAYISKNIHNKETNTSNIIIIKEDSNNPRARDFSEPVKNDDDDDNDVCMNGDMMRKSGGCIVSDYLDRELLKANRGCPLHSKDERELLFWCKYLIDTKKVQSDDPGSQLRILSKWMKNGGIKKPVGYGEPKPQPKYASERDRFSQQATSGAAYTMVARQAEERRTAEQEANSRQIAEEAIAEIKSKLGSCFKRVNQDE